MTMSTTNASVSICEPEQLQWLKDNNFTFSFNLRGALLLVPQNTSHYENGVMVNCSYQDTSVTYPIPIGKMITFVFLGCLALVGNICVFTSLYCRRHRLSRVSFFIMHLAVADLFVVLMHVPVDLIWEATYVWHGGNFLCKLIMFLRNVGLYVSAFILVSISLDRVLAITRPLSLLKAENSRCAICGFKRSKVMVLTSWTLSAICSAPQLFLWRTYTHDLYPWLTQCLSILTMNKLATESLIYNFFHFITVFATPLIAISGCYIKVLIILTKKSSEHKKNPAMRKRSSAPNEDTFASSSKMTNYQPIATSGGNFERARVRTLKMTFIIVCVFIACWTPYFAINILWWTNVKLAGEISTYESLKFFSAFLIANSSLNPIVYGMFASRLSDTCVRLCLWGERDANISVGNGSVFRPSRLGVRHQHIQMTQRNQTAYTDFRPGHTMATTVTTVPRTDRLKIGV